MTEILPSSPPQQSRGSVHNNVRAREAAEKLEATFLAEMLKSAGFGTQSNSFSGGVGKDQFASFQRQALAEQMVKAGGIGLAETFYQAILEKTHDT